MDKDIRQQMKAGLANRVNKSALEFHLLGQHDQKTHGHPQGGTAIKAGPLNPKNVRDTMIVVGNANVKKDFNQAASVIDGIHTPPRNLLRGSIVTIGSELPLPNGVPGFYTPALFGTKPEADIIIRRPKPNETDPMNKLLDETRPVTIVKSLGYEYHKKLGSLTLKSPLETDKQLGDSIKNSKAVKTFKNKSTLLDEYNTRNSELFSRAYTQWIATKTSDSNFRDQFNRLRKGSKGLFWSDEDFKPISTEMDRFFNKRGLLK